MRRDVRRQVLRALRQLPLPAHDRRDRQYAAGMLVIGPQLFDLDSQVGLAVKLPDGTLQGWRSSVWEWQIDFINPPIRRLQTTQEAIEEARKAMLEFVGARLG